MTNEELVAKIQAGENVQENMAQLYQENLPLITKIVFPFTKAAELDDLLQEAYFGLERAVKKFDPTMGFKFMTFAEWDIRSVIRRYLENCGQTIRIPPYMIEKISKYQKFKADFTQITGYEPTDKEYRQHLGVPQKELAEIRKYMVTSETVSIDQIVPGTEDFTLADTLADPDSDFEERIMEDSAIEQGKNLLWEAVSELHGNAPKVIEGSFREQKTLDEMSNQFNLSRERVRQIRISAIKRLRSMRKVIETAEIFGYESRMAYKWGLQRFKDTNTSSTEFLALKHIEQEERAKNIVDNQREISSTVNLTAERFKKLHPNSRKVPIGIRNLQKLTAEAENLIKQLNELKANRTSVQIK